MPSCSETISTQILLALLPCRPSAMPTFCHADWWQCGRGRQIQRRAELYDTRARGDFRLGARCEGPGPVLMPFSQAASLPCRPFTMPPFDTPARGLHGGSDRATDAARPVAPARCSPLLAARPELTTAIPTHPCHAAFLPCRISSASPPAEPLHRTSIAQSHAVARAGAGDSSPHGSSHAALVAHVAPQPTHPINVAPLPCRPCAAPPPVPSFHTADWLPQATAHIPARSGRQQIHTSERASGGASHPNRGIGRGYALGTALAQADFRESTTVCASPECAALIDEHWLRRSSHRDCGWCRGHRGNVGKHIRYQLEMANALEGGRRRLAAWVEEDGLLQPYTLPTGAVTLVVEEARARVQHLRAHPPRRGRPPAAPPPPAQQVPTHAPGVGTWP